MSLSGSPIVNHGPDSDAQVFIPLGNGKVSVLLRFSFEERRQEFLQRVVSLNLNLALSLSI